MQYTLFEHLNPLNERVGLAFFKNAPKRPGVYLMKNASGDILYVGKAKDLRARLNSYRRARPSEVSRKTVRLLRMVHSIEVRVCENEVSALLSENQLLRDLRPPFNVLNTSPETYYYWVLERRSDWLGAPVEGRIPVRFRLTNEDLAETRLMGARVFGVFKGRRRARESFQAILRLLVALDARDETFRFPATLTRYRTPREFTVVIPEKLLRGMHEFLSGRSSAFLRELTETLLSNEGIPRFIHHVITEDLKALEDFYVYGPRRVQALRRRYKLGRSIIAQEEIDDLLAIEHVRRRGRPLT